MSNPFRLKRSLKRHPMRRLLAAGTAISMLLDFGLPVGASAGISAPPSRVGQIANITGSVSFNGSGSNGWAQAALNYPVSAGDSLYTQDSSQAALAIDSSTLTLAADTELQVTALDDETMAATESQGEVFLAIGSLQQGQSFTIATPRGTVTINQNGQYDIAAGDTNNPTTVTVFQGGATITDPGATLQVPAGQSGVLTGTDQTTAQLAAAQPDAFAQRLLQQNQPAPPSYAPPVVSQMTGTSELGQYGSWNQSPQYGAVWYPQVDNGWAPYREGHWVDVQPWGWTWVDNEPWGFAPFHYGRWIQDDGRWGWAPAPAYDDGGDYGPSYQPVYAPAVVSFFGLAVAAGITAAAFSNGSVGWVPLAPDEAYYPSYRCPPDYIRRINVVNVRNINIVNIHNTNYYGNNFAPGRFANHGGGTYIPADAMGRGEPVARYGHPVTPGMYGNARPVDPGFAHQQGGAANGGFRLPAAAGIGAGHPGIAPRPAAFGERHALPPAVISHTPYTGRPGAAPAGLERPGVGLGAPSRAGLGAPSRVPGPPGAMGGGLPHPSFGNNPGFRPPPPPPEHGQHLGTLPPAPGIRPGAMNEGPRPGGAVPGFHPPGTTRPQAAPQGYHPQTEPRPASAAPGYRPQEEPRPTGEMRPQGSPQVFHSQEPRPQVQNRPEGVPQMFHPQEPRPMQAQPMEQPHFNAQPRPAMNMPRPEAPRPQAPRPQAPQHEKHPA